MIKDTWFHVFQYIHPKELYTNVVSVCKDFYHILELSYTKECFFRNAVLADFGKNGEFLELYSDIDVLKGIRGSTWELVYKEGFAYLMKPLLRCCQKDPTDEIWFVDWSFDGKFCIAASNDRYAYVYRYKRDGNDHSLSLVEKVYLMGEVVFVKCFKDSVILSIGNPEPTSILFSIDNEGLKQNRIFQGSSPYDTHCDLVAYDGHKYFMKPSHASIEPFQYTRFEFHDLNSEEMKRISIRTDSDFCHFGITNGIWFCCATFVEYTDRMSEICYIKMEEALSSPNKDFKWSDLNVIPIFGRLLSHAFIEPNRILILYRKTYIAEKEHSPTPRDFAFPSFKEYLEMMKKVRRGDLFAVPWLSSFISMKIVDLCDPSNPIEVDFPRTTCKTQLPNQTFLIYPHQLGNLLVFSDELGLLTVFHLASLLVVEDFRIHSDLASYCCFHPCNPKVLLSGTDAGELCVHEFDHHYQYIDKDEGVER